MYLYCNINQIKNQYIWGIRKRKYTLSAAVFRTEKPSPTRARFHKPYTWMKYLYNCLCFIMGIFFFVLPYQVCVEQKKDAYAPFSFALCKRKLFLSFSFSARQRVTFLFAHRFFHLRRVDFLYVFGKTLQQLMPNGTIVHWQNLFYLGVAQFFGDAKQI